MIVVGAGLAGCALAWHLSRGRRVLLVDQAEQPGAEASGQNAGMVRTLGEDPWERALALRTDAWLAEPGDDWAEAPPSRVIGALVGLAWDRHHLHDAAAHLRARGRRVEAVDRPASLAPALHGSKLPFAWYLPDERVADAWSMIGGFLRGARARGAEVMLRTRVTGLRMAGGRVVGVNTDSGPLDAAEVVLASGAWTATLAATAGLERPLVPLRRSLALSRPHPLALGDHPWVWIDDEGVYARPEGGRWLVSGCDEAVDWPRQGPGSQGSLTPERWAEAEDRLVRWMPALAGISPERGWSGLRCFAPDRRPVMGADPDLPGLWWAAGLGGFGVTCAYAVGEAVAAWMLGIPTPWLSPAGVSPGRAMPRRWVVRTDGRLNTTALGPVPPRPTSA